MDYHKAVEDFVLKLCTYGNQSIEYSEQIPIRELRRIAGRVEELYARLRGITL